MILNFDNNDNKDYIIINNNMVSYLEPIIKLKLEFMIYYLKKLLINLVNYYIH